MRSLVSFLLLLLAGVARAISSSGPRVLAIFEDLEEQSKYSKFIGDLEGRGFKLSHATPKMESLSLFHLGERVFDHVIIFPTKAKGLGPNLTAKLLLDFINADGNILLALSSSHAAPTAINSLLLELDISLPADRTGLVVDHFNYDAASAADSHDVLLLPSPGKLRSDLKEFFGGDSSDVIAFPRGVGHTLGDGALLSPILRAPSTAYSYNPKEQAETLDELFAAGEQLALVSAVQARNSARFTVVGSAEMLEDKWFDAKVKKAGEKGEVKTYNREFAKRLAGWTFKELGVLRVNWIEHRLNEEGVVNVTNPKIYRIKNDVTYSISISEWSWDKWTSFVVPEGDEIQLEFSMLSPFQRLPLKPLAAQESADATVFGVSFKLPDHHGIFNFLVNYKRPFLTSIEEKNTVSVRHMAHDEWPRSYVISGAWPWLAGIGATVTGWLAFVLVWMFSQPIARVVGHKKTQ
ncbi:Dolichyl-diphosphooligosaccharide--protein glycosyltransferase subunit WBP1 [Pleurostoma richardsiae]|uniref:Dolichyl-diphosphooligosaccharide--protein glycosyltransferase subunit WBP1 n=1 Tax=Pleurostoma richardsiae TaxID=41990 RepID=A0AA38RS33_9PEZI|nr:Dolichyl-diphosphooligosaccharide--protein glycosyltransferase subunit WBP1 [Pleurostoma richardsiae]